MVDRKTEETEVGLRGIPSASFWGSNSVTTKFRKKSADQQNEPDQVMSKWC